MKWLAVICNIFVFSVLSFGQAAADDIDRLRQFLNIHESTRIRIATSDRLVKDNTQLRVFLFTGSDTRARAKYARHVKNWNKSREAKRYGPLELVNDIYSADVVLVKQSFPGKARTQIIPIVSTESVYDPITKSTVNRRTTKTNSIRAVPFQVHILRITPEGIEIVRAISSVEVFRDNERDGTGDPLWEQFRELVIGG